MNEATRELLTTALNQAEELTRIRAEHARLVAAIQEAVALLDFEANLGTPGHQRVVSEVIRRLTTALNMGAM